MYALNQETSCVDMGLVFVSLFGAMVNGDAGSLRLSL